MRLDRYEIVRGVATGGMGRVWLGRMSGKHGFEKLVAIKTFRPDIAPDADTAAKLRAMLLDEARICSRIQHAGVAQILDVGEAGASPYVVFEWVDGAALRDLYADAEAIGRRVPQGPLLRVVAVICDALHAAHELTDDGGHRLQVVHRDVTPGNVIVGRTGFAKLIDFGVARARDRLAGETRSGIVKGTPQFMAPEQAQGARVDRRADVWALGAVLYRGLAGRAPFRDRIEMQAFVQRGEGPPPLPDAVVPEVREIVSRAMQRDPAARFQTAAEMGAAVERVLATHPGSTAIRDLFVDDGPPPASEVGTVMQKRAADPKVPPPVDRTLEPAVRPATTSRGALARASGTTAIVFAVAVAAAILAIAALAWALLGGG
jgi:serine/threonine protein kinase